MTGDPAADGLRDDGGRTGGPPLDDDAATIEELRHRIENTREELGRTVQALAAKTDVKTRAQHTVIAAAHEIHEKAGEATADLQETAAGIWHRVEERIPEPVHNVAATAKNQVVDTTAAVAQQVQKKTPPVVRDKAQTVTGAVRRYFPEIVLASTIGMLMLSIRLIRRAVST
ncbi:MAG: DUF3618 domain-containing protein [Catenulispora sp.]